MAPRNAAAPEPITCPKCGSREFLRVVGGIEIHTEFTFDEKSRKILLRFDRETMEEPNDGADYYRKYMCSRCMRELPTDIMNSINDEGFEEISEA